MSTCIRAHLRVAFPRSTSHASSTLTVPCRCRFHVSQHARSSVIYKQHQAIQSIQNWGVDTRHVLQKKFNSFQKNSVRFSHGSTNMAHRAFIALGSNMGDRVAMIEHACQEMEASGKIRIRRTSSLWETKAMYVLDQDMFINGACEVSSIWLV